MKKPPPATASGAPRNAVRFHSWREALAWANIIARTSRTRTKVKKYGTQWYAWRQI